MNQEAASLDLQQSRSLGVEQGTANISQYHDRIDELTNETIKSLPEDQQLLIKKELSEQIYIKFGNNANIHNIYYNPDKNEISAGINFAYEVKINLDDLSLHKTPEDKALLSTIRTAELEHNTLIANSCRLETMIHKAIESRNGMIEEMNLTITESSQGLKGFFNKLTNQIPKPIPSVDEHPITENELKRGFYQAEFNSSDFKQFIDTRLSGIQENTTKALSDIENNLRYSEGQLQSLINNAKISFGEKPLQAEREERFIGEKVACEYLIEYEYDSGKAWTALRNHRNTYPGLREEDRNAEHYLYALSQVETGDTSWLFMNVLTDGYSIYKGLLNTLQTVSFDYYQSPYRGSPTTWSENLSGHLGTDDAIFGVNCSYYEK